MNRVFAISSPFQVPDGTWVSPFLNAKDSESDLPFDLLDGFSLAAGTIEPSSSSRIHVMPLVSQVTFVRAGELAVRMKGTNDVQPYLLRLAPAEAVLTEPGVYFQLVNEGSEPCEVLYIVSPAYVFEMDGEGRILYDDALVLEEDWETLAESGWRTARALPTDGQRTEALGRLANRKPSGSPR
jgi:mannose-6-phosphate isomerase-like protein (cupin superfamily)